MPGVPVFTVVTPPAPLLALADARAYPGVPASASDAFVQSCLDAAIGYLDGPCSCGGWLNRSLGQQTIQCTITRGRGFRRPDPIILEGGPVLDITSITGLGGADSFSTATYDLDGDAVTLYDSVGPTMSGVPLPVVVRYTAGSPANVLAAVKPVILAMVAKLIGAATQAGRDPALRSESIPDTFSKSWDTSGQGGAFGLSTLAPLQRFQRFA